MTPKQLAKELDVTPRTIVAMIKRGDIKNYIDNGAKGNGKRYWIDVTREYGKGER